jgi:nucleotide-binding universal stress UspA family protein
MKRILVPTDFKLAENALQVAASIAKKNNCDLHLLEFRIK